MKVMTHEFGMSMIDMVAFLNAPYYTTSWFNWSISLPAYMKAD